MARINVIVAVATEEKVDRVLASGIAAAVRRHGEMGLVQGDVLAAALAVRLVASLPPAEPCALILVGPAEHTAAPGREAGDVRADLIVLRVTSEGDVRVRATLHAVGLPQLLAELRSLVERDGLSPEARARIAQAGTPRGEPADAHERPPARPALAAAVKWIHATLLQAVRALPEATADKPWFSLSRGTVLKDLEQGGAGHLLPPADDVAAAEAALDPAFDAQGDDEPLVVIGNALALEPLERRMLLLALAPEIDPLYQRCIGVLLDDAGRRVGTLGLFAGLLGSASEVRRALEAMGGLARWRLFESRGGHLPGADEPLRVDTAIAAWILGDASALEHDPRVRRVLRVAPWPGAALLGEPESLRGADLVARLGMHGKPRWMLLAGDIAAWRALLEAGAQRMSTKPLRVDSARLPGLEPLEVEESALRLGRLARLSRAPLVVDAAALDPAGRDDEAARVLLATLDRHLRRCALLAVDDLHVARLLAPMRYLRMDDALAPGQARDGLVRRAAEAANARASEDDARTICRRYPLRIDGLEDASRRAASAGDDVGGDALERFTAACRDVASAGISRLVERIDPVFRLGQVVLPKDRHDQLLEIVDTVRLAPKVLDEWRFGAQLAYGRGVTALFHGPSGTGKTMAALAISRELGVQVLRLDLSKVVSKYIGDTEKNLDIVFEAAERSGCALLLDEADALLGKRTEVKDAHDRYANIEIAYLLTRLESFCGPAALFTSNRRQDLEPALLRRLRFMIDFPRPDAYARELIWRHCLPEGTHALDDAAFAQLARRLDLTGGHIRQITLRAAFLAAAEGVPIELRHIAHAARAELAKLGMPPAEVEAIERRKAA